MTTAPRACFVISPIGPESSALRRHADDVFDFIVKPAVDACGIHARRSDHLREPGRITEQMFREITGSHCCICILTGNNPNVYYELAVAQSAGTPVVILIEKGHDLPFDVRDLRCVSYDLSPRPLFEKQYANEVVDHLRSLELAGWKATPLFDWRALPRRRGSGLPQSLLDELEAPHERRREALSNQQKQILTKVEGICRAKGRASQAEIARAHGRDGQPDSNRPHDDPELFYRLEQLRLLGFLERRRDPTTNQFEYTLADTGDIVRGPA